MIKLAGFDRGAVFLDGKNNELKLAFSLGIRDDRKAAEILARRSGATVSSPVECEPGTIKLSRFRRQRFNAVSIVRKFTALDPNVPAPADPLWPPVISAVRKPTGSPQPFERWIP